MRALPGPSIAILAAVLALTLARRSGVERSLWRTAATLPAVAIAAALVGYLLVTLPLVGAALFITSVVLSVWLRQFGARAAKVGGLIALPFVVILIAPVRPNAPGGPLVNLALVVCAGLVAVAWAAIVRFLAARIGLERAASERRTSRDEPRVAKAG